MHPDQLSVGRATVRELVGELVRNWAGLISTRRRANGSTSWRHAAPQPDRPRSEGWKPDLSEQWETVSSRYA
jgi:hypothetical protein